jgi:hypothetical protein
MLKPAAAAKPDREVLTTQMRWFEASFDLPMVILFGFFALHQATNTGFFTAKFGSIEMLALYGPIIVALVAPAVRALTGRRNPARPWDVAMQLSLAAGSLYLLIVFPFNFSHLGDLFPGVLRLFVSWISDDVGKVLMVLQVILGPVNAIMTTAKYISLR